jgi:hypothetical protein
MMIPTLGERNSRISAKTRRRAKNSSSQSKFTEVIRDVLEEDAVHLSPEKDEREQPEDKPKHELPTPPPLLLDGLDITV